MLTELLSILIKQYFPKELFILLFKRSLKSLCSVLKDLKAQEHFHSKNHILSQDIMICLFTITHTPNSSCLEFEVTWLFLTYMQGYLVWICLYVA